ncbi:MAG: gluconate 2-dehydrogenase subunit 3 family protein [Bryobacteraceae bacterium]|nr:gluconate 2-dehydrogenase subunit 3 family protein [Bryobacteraceae bacterium]
MLDRRQALYALLGLTSFDAVGQITLSPAEVVAQGQARFFSKPELESLRALAQALVPAYQGRPGAVEAEAPEFLDFLLSQSPADAQQIYRTGLAQYTKSRDLRPLEQPWTYEEPRDPYARFLRAAKSALYQATVNSQAWAKAANTRGGSGLYWLPID